jgi:hypothetical protein
MNPTSCLFGSRFVWAQTAIFSAEPRSKNAEKSTIVLWITARESDNPNQNSATLWRIFQHIKAQQPIGRKDSVQIVIRTSRRLDSFLF